MSDESLKTKHRKIIHVDMDAFYASVEQKDNPELKGKPVAVGGSRQRGVVAAASYEARKYGVRSAMSSQMAYRYCPQIVFVKPRFDRYKEISNKIRAVFHRYTDLVEPLSLDEAYLDVTENKIGLPSATLIAKAIKKDILKETGLYASAGISINKFLAKIASDYDKPNGFFVILPEEVPDFLEKLPIARFYGVGKVTAEKLYRMGVFFGKDLLPFTEKQLTERFGKFGHYLYEVARGEDNRRVNPSRDRKSIGAEKTLDQDVTNYADFIELLEPVLKKVWQRYEASGKKAFTITLKLKFSDFTQITRSITLEQPVQSVDTLRNESHQLFEEFKEKDFRIRLIGTSLSGIDKAEDNKPEKQLTLKF